MKDKFFMMAGLGVGKVVPIVLGFFLARKFGAAYFSDFVLFSAYSAALSAIATMGAMPRILRAGVHSNPGAVIVQISLTGFILWFFSVVVSIIYWFFSSPPFMSLGLSHAGVQVSVILFTAGLVLYGLALSTCSFYERFCTIGFYTALVYAVGAFLSLALGGGQGETFIIYCAAFFFLAFLFFIDSQRSLILEWFVVFRKFSIAKTFVEVLRALGGALFGLITMAGIYVFMHFAQFSLVEDGRAIFSLGFQLFQAVLFIPSAFGSVLVPYLVASGGLQAKDYKKMKLFYLSIGLFLTAVVWGGTEKILKIYGLPEMGETAVLIMLLAAVVAGQLTLFTQIFVSEGKFVFLSINASLWLLFSCLAKALIGDGVSSVAGAFFLAYVGCLGVAWLAYWFSRTQSGAI